VHKSAEPTHERRAARYSWGLMTIARTAWKAGFPDIVVHTAERVRNAHAHYARAKSGDREAATRLAYDLIGNAALESIRQQVGGRRPLLVPVRAVETTGINLIPDALSHEMAIRLGLEVGDRADQHGRAHSSGWLPPPRLPADVRRTGRGRTRSRPGGRSRRPW